MKCMTDRQSVPANSATVNVLAGKLYEFAPEDGMLELGICASAVGLRCTLIVGGEVIIDDQEVSSASRFPLKPDDTLASVAVLAGERIVLTYRNTTGAAITVTSCTGFMPI
jgi:hypothetical protein